MARNGEGHLPDHPAPYRGHVGLSTLWFGLLAPPAAWSIQIVVSYSLASLVCFPHDTPLAAPVFTGTWWILLAINAAALAATVAAILVAYRAWHASLRDRPSDSAASALESGAGRSRFMAISGILLGGGFVVLSIFMISTLFVVPLCAA